MDNYPTPRPGKAEILNFIVDQVAKYTELPPAKIKVTTEFLSFGLDSVDAAGISGELSEWLQVELEENLLWDYPTPAELAEYLAELG